MAASLNAGMLGESSAPTVEQTVDKRKDMHQRKGVTLFSFVDHSELPEKVGMPTGRTTLLVLGSLKRERR